MEDLLFNILMAIVVAIAGIVAKNLLPYLNQKRAEAEAKLRSTKWAWAVDIINAVVRAVEQTVAEDVHGEEKKAVALKYITELLNQNGIDLTYEEIDALVEAAVNTMNSGFISVETVGSIPDDSEPVEADSAIVAQLIEQLDAEEAD